MLQELYSELKRSWDLTAVVLLSLSLVLFIFLLPDNPFRIIIGLPFLLFFPGYSLVASIYPDKNSLDLIERIALSLGLSIAVVPLIGFSLNFTPFGIRLIPILSALILFDITLSIIGLFKRNITNDPYLPTDPKQLLIQTKSRFQGETKINKVLIVILAVAVISSISALIYAVSYPREAEHFSEFYILGSDDIASDYPNTLQVNQSGHVIIGVANHENRVVNYTVEIWLSNVTNINNKTTVDQLYNYGAFNIKLNSTPINGNENWTAQWQTDYNFSVPFTGQFKIWFILLLDGQPYNGPSNIDVADTDASARFINMVNDKSHYSLNLNINITA